jgi:hypothetical protein
MNVNAATSSVAASVILITRTPASTTPGCRAETPGHNFARVSALWLPKQLSAVYLVARDQLGR